MIRVVSFVIWHWKNTTMIKKILFAIGTLVASLLYAQPDTDVHVFDLLTKNDSIFLTNGINISNNEGYDNQPSFYDDDNILFASTRNKQTDIAQYNSLDGTTIWLNNTAEGSEYSPLRMPDQNTISAIRLDTTGLQRLYAYNTIKISSEVLAEGLKIGYHVWQDAHTIVATVLIENRMDLVSINTKNNKVRTYQKNVGRSLHKIPNTNLVSYISKATKDWEIKSLDLKSGKSETILKSIPEVEDMCWLKDGTILMARNKFLVAFHPKKDKQWRLVKNFQDKNINNITRIALNGSNTKLALVAEGSPERIVQKSVDAFNARNLDAFVNCYTDNVLVQNFPNDTSYVGKKAMKTSYKRFYENTKDVQVAVLKRIVVGNMVVDHELETKGGKEHHQAAIYKVENGLIKSMTFIHKGAQDDTAEAIVQKQLEAYNKRDIDAFADTYADDIRIYNFPARLSSEGIGALRDGYAGFFKETEDLNCVIKNRIVLGNIIIDEEYITMNGNNISAIAIYEVANGKIFKVTFL